jgi:eukaryotic-like serine/threonine-protein kinase
VAGDRPPSQDLERLVAIGTPGGPNLDEALRLFAHLRTTPEERRAIERLLARGDQPAMPDPLMVAVVSALLDRGEDAAAGRALAHRTSSAALMLRAELAARGGDRAAAVALVERVLSRDFDWPGARERLARWREGLGITRAPHLQAWDTVVASAASASAAPFELLREVGRGGSGTVYEAKDRALGRTVALKAYHQPARDRAQLLHEGRVAAVLSGPGIVRIFDLDPQHGWLAMEWAALGALRALLRLRQVETLAPVARWALPLAAALARVHAAGWVHLDVKPANILMRQRAAPLLSDFGTARRTGEPSPPGSLGYVSPERLAGRPSDPRDDVYGFGRVLDDALDVLETPDASDEATPLRVWRALAEACAGSESERPRDGAALLSSVTRVAGAEAG